MRKHLHDSVGICHVSVAKAELLDSIASPAILVGVVLTVVVLDWIRADSFGDLRQHRKVAASYVLNLCGVSKQDVLDLLTLHSGACGHKNHAFRRSSVVDATGSQPWNSIERTGNGMLPVFREQNIIVDGHIDVVPVDKKQVLHRRVDGVHFRWPAVELMKLSRVCA